MFFLRLPEVLARTGLARSTVYELVAAGKFPAPVRLGPRRVGWAESEIEKWAMERVAERDAKAAAAA